MSRRAAAADTPPCLFLPRHGVPYTQPFLVSPCPSRRWSCHCDQTLRSGAPCSSSLQSLASTALRASCFFLLSGHLTHLLSPSACAHLVNTLGFFAAGLACPAHFSTACCCSLNGLEPHIYNPPPGAREHKEGGEGSPPYYYGLRSPSGKGIIAFLLRALVCDLLDPELGVPGFVQATFLAC